MGKALKLHGVTLTDPDAPVLLHTAGVAGYDRRFAIESLGDVGSNPTVWPNAVTGGTALTNNQPTLARVVVDGAAGKAFAPPPAAGTSGSSAGFKGGMSAAGPVTIIAVARVSGENPLVNTSGALVRAWSNGRVGLGSGALYVDGAAGAWAFIAAVSDGASSALWVNGTKVTGALAASTDLEVKIGSEGTSGQTRIREIITYPVALSDADIAEVRAAMKAHHAFLP